MFARMNFRKEKKIREEKKSEEGRCRCVKNGKAEKHSVFQCFVAPKGRKVGSLKRRARSHLVRDQELHAAVVQSTCRSQNGKSTLGSKHFWKWRCHKSARSRGAKHIWKS